MLRLIQLSRVCFSQGCKSVDSSATFKSKTRIQPLVHYSENLMLSVAPLKAFNNANGEKYTKNGILVISMMPCVKEPGTDRMAVVYHKRLGFVTTLLHMGNFLLLNDETISNKRIDIDLQYSTKSGLGKSLKLHKLPTEQLAIFQLETSLSQSPPTQPSDPSSYRKYAPNYQGKYSMRVSKGYLVALRELVHYSLPFMVGWQSIRFPSYKEAPLAEPFSE